jgi:hypothetical protein
MKVTTVQSPRVLTAMTLTAPTFETTLPRQSLGAVPDEGAESTQCS